MDFNIESGFLSRQRGMKALLATTEPLGSQRSFFAADLRRMGCIAALARVICVIREISGRLNHSSRLLSPTDDTDFHGLLRYVYNTPSQQTTCCEGV